MRPPAWVAVAAAAVMCSLACGSKNHAAESSGDDAGDDAAADSGSVPLDAPDAVDSGEAGFLGDGSTVSNCDPAATLVYVATEEKQLYSFDPQHNVFTLLADIDCANGDYVNSMAVDRNAVAWINYGDGSLWTIDTKVQQPPCTSTTFIPNQGGIGLFGMAFAAKVAGGNTETLFIDDLNGGGLGFIDLTTMTLERFGPFTGDLAGRSAELTGTGDARLFGFFAGSPLGDAGSASVTQIDPDSEAPLTQYPLPTVDTGSDWAFSFWGGDFYLYTADKYDENQPDTVVTRFRPSDGSVTIVDAALTFRIVGAGSSTCAPTTPPQ